MQSESRILTALVGVRMLPEEMARGEELAKRANTTLASMMRANLLATLDRNGTGWAETLFEQRDAALAALARVRRLHRRGESAGADFDTCVHCSSEIRWGWVRWPCPTVRALEGDDALCRLAEMLGVGDAETPHAGRGGFPVELGRPSLVEGDARPGGSLQNITSAPIEEAP